MRSLTKCAIVALVLAVASTAQANVTIEVLDPAEGKFLVTYEVTATKAHSTELSFPRGGLPSRDKHLEVVSVTEKNTDQEFEHDILPYKGETGAVVEGRYVIKAKFTDPIPEGGKHVLEYKMILYNKARCFVDRDGRWMFKYDTSCDAFFVLPEGQAIVYANHPVLVYQKAGRTVLQQKADPRKRGQDTVRKLIFKTHAAKE